MTKLAAGSILDPQGYGPEGMLKLKEQGVELEILKVVL